MVCYALRLRPGEELKGALTDFVSDKGIRVRSRKLSRHAIRLTTCIRCPPRLGCNPVVAVAVLKLLTRIIKSMVTG